MKKLLLIGISLTLGFSTNYQTKAINYFSKGDYKNAIKYYGIDCENNKNIDSCLISANLSQTALNNEKKALTYYKKACKLNNKVGCAMSGKIEYKLNHKKEAFKFDEKACKLNSPKGCNAMGDFYFKGELVKKDLKTSFNYYKKSCKLNSPAGCNSLGLAYEKGLGTEIDLIKAREIYAKSCRWGYQKGCNNFNRISKNKNAYR